MTTSEVKAIQAWAWYESVKDGKYERFNLECNKTAVFSYLDAQLEQTKPESITAAFAAAEGNGNRLPNGFQLAVKTNPQIAEEAAAKRAADQAAEVERQRLADIAAENRRFELIEFVSQHRGATTPHALAVEKDIVSHFSIAQLEQAAADIRLRQESRGQTAAQFAKAHGLDKIDATGKEIRKTPGAVVLPPDLTRAKFKAMQPFQIRLLVKSYVVKGHSDRAVWAALNALV